ncbi:MAG: alkaline phosphatase D family protein [Acidobacteriota bacterium]
MRTPLDRRRFLATLASSAAVQSAAIHGLVPASLAAIDPDSRQATGLKIGEVTPTSALAWMRLTETPSRQADGERRRGRPQPFPENRSTRELEGSTPGAPGRLRLRYSTKENLSGARDTGWTTVDPARDFSHQFALQGLRPDTEYFYSAESSDAAGKLHAPLKGRFRTALPADSTSGLRFCMTTCQKYSELDHADGFNIYNSMGALDPRFYISAGDIVYYDSDDPRATSIPLARYHWDRMFSFPRHRDMLLHVPGYFTKDDHDTMTDDVWPDMKLGPEYKFNFQDGVRIFREQVPMGASTYRTHRWGKTLQLWFTEGRDFRSPNNAPDGPGHTIWGETQKAWLMKSMAESTADWRVLITPTPIVGPDRPTKHDNHSNRDYAWEGRQFREWAKNTLGDNFVDINGDRHWQYHSVHPETGTNEFSVGPASDSHASGTPGEDKNYHRFHRVKGGFLEVETERKGKESFLHFRLRDVVGAQTYAYTFTRAVKG